MLHIEEIRLREIRLPLREPFQISSGTMAERRILLLELLDADGSAAWAECVVDALPNYSPETVETARLAIREWVAPRVLGRAIGHPGEVHDLLARDFRGHNMAKAAVEMGCWGLAAQKRGVALAELVGGTRERIATGISLGIQRDPAALVERAAAALREGYRKIKLKIKPGADVEYVAAVREALGPGAHLMADANSAYTLADADRLTRLDEFDLMMIEQPLACDDLVRHAELQRRLRTPLCLDESITDLDRAEDMIALGSGRIVNIKPGRVGGFTSSQRIHDLCMAHGVPVWCGGMLESGIGRAYNVALASLPGFTLPGDLSPSARYWERDVIVPEWTMDAGGMVAVPRGRPGLGVEVDVDRIDDLTTRLEALRAARPGPAQAGALAASPAGGDR
jgi:o-succinylbenzoate synthase